MAKQTHTWHLLRWMRVSKLALFLVLVPLAGLGLYMAAMQVRAQLDLHRGKKALANRQFVQAREHFIRCLLVWPDDAQVGFLAARSARMCRDYAEVERLLGHCRQQGGVTGAINLEALLTRTQRGEMAGKEGYLWALVNKNYEDSPAILEALAQGYIHQRRWPDALQCLQRLLDNSPANVDFIVWRGWTFENLGRIGPAMDDFRRAVELDPDHEAARLSLAEALLQSSRPAEALAHFELLRRRDPEDAAALLGLARCRRQLGELEQARQLLKQLLARQPRNARSLAEQGKLASDEGKFDEAEKWFRQSLALDLRDRETNYDLFICLRRLGKDAEASQCQARLKEIEADQDRLMELLNQMVHSPGDLLLPCGIAEILMQNSQDDQARTWLEGVLQRNAEFKPAHMLLAEYYRRRGLSSRAEHHSLRSQ